MSFKYLYSPEQEVCDHLPLEKGIKLHFAPEEQLFKYRMLFGFKNHLVSKDLYCLSNLEWLWYPSVCRKVEMQMLRSRRGKKKKIKKWQIENSKRDLQKYPFFTSDRRDVESFFTWIMTNLHHIFYYEIYKTVVALRLEHLSQKCVRTEPASSCSLFCILWSSKNVL